MDVTSDEQYESDTTGGVSVHSGATLTIAGRHDGAVEILDGGTVVVTGALHGPLSINSLGTASVSGQVVGAVDILVAGTLVVEKGGSVWGAVTNRGSFTNFGQRSGHVEGRTPDDRPGAEVTTTRAPA